MNTKQVDGLRIAAQNIVNAFATMTPNHVFATIDLNDGRGIQRIESNKEAPLPTWTAIHAFADAMSDAFGVRRDQLEARICLDPDRSQGTENFKQARIGTLDSSGGYPTCFVQVSCARA